MAKFRASYPQWKKIESEVDFLIHETEDFIVFLDHDLEVDWATSDRYDKENRRPQEWAEIQNRYTALEATLSAEVSGSTRKKAQRMLGECADKGLGGDVVAAVKHLDEAEGFILARNRELGRLLHLIAAAWTIVPIVGLCLAVWIGRGVLEPLLGPMVFSLILYCGSGCVGAFVSILWSLKTALPDPHAEGRAHRAEAITRIFAGGVGAVLVALAVRGGVLLPQLNTLPGGLYVLLLACIATGASDKIAPDLVRKLEARLNRSEAPQLGLRDESDGRGRRKRLRAEGSRQSGVRGKSNDSGEGQGGSSSGE
jgi:hypothetical protein